MTKLLEQAVNAARGLPPGVQDGIARVVLELVGEGDAPIGLSNEERAAIDRSKAAAARGEFASDDQVRAIWAKYGL